jgi:ATP-dependent Zn protease
MQAAGTMDIDTAKRFAVAAICAYTVEGNIARFDEHQIRSRQREIDGLIHEALEEAIRMVDENLDAITRVAEQLLRRGKLMGSEVAAIVNACRKREDE